MQQIALSREVRREAMKDPAVAAALDDEVRQESVRYTAWAEENARASGVCMSGMEPGAFVMRTGQQMLDAAKEKVAKRTAWDATPEGRFVDGVVRAQALAVDIAQQFEMARNARCRSWHGELRTCDAALARVKALLAELTLAAQDASLAVDDEFAAVEAA